MPAKGKRTSGLLTQQKMLRAAVEIFLEKGYEHTTTAEIAVAAGMRPSSFFRAYPSKEAILLDLVQRMFSGQFELAGRLICRQDPLVLYGIETALQLHIAELSEPLRDLYVAAYSLPLHQPLHPPHHGEPPDADLRTVSAPGPGEGLL